MTSETGRNPDIVVLGREKDIELVPEVLPQGGRAPIRLDPNDLRPETVIAELRRVQKMVLIVGPRGMPHHREVLLELARVTERGKRVRFVPVKVEVEEMARSPARQDLQ